MSSGWNGCSEGHIVARMEPTGRANARPIINSAKSGNHAAPAPDCAEPVIERRFAPTRSALTSFRDAPLGAGPESILPVVVMDSGLALRAPRNDEDRHFFAANRLAHVISPPPAASPPDKMLF